MSIHPGDICPTPLGYSTSIQFACVALRFTITPFPTCVRIGEVRSAALCTAKSLSTSTVTVPSGTSSGYRCTSPCAGAGAGAAVCAGGGGGAGAAVLALLSPSSSDDFFLQPAPKSSAAVRSAV